MWGGEPPKALLNLHKPAGSSLCLLTHLGRQPRSWFCVCHSPVNACVPSWQHSPSKGWVFPRKPETDCSVLLGKLRASSIPVLAREDGCRQPVPKQSKAFPPGPPRPWNNSVFVESSHLKKKIKRKKQHRKPFPRPAAIFCL